MGRAQPLAGKTILITRAAGQSSQFGELLQAQGAAVLEMPALALRPPSSWAALDAAIAQLAGYDWLILTSANAVSYFFERRRSLGLEAPFPAQVKLAVVGKKTAAVLAAWGLSPDFVPPDFIADALVAHFPVPVTGLQVLFPRVESGGRELLAQQLTAAGAWVNEVPAYESGCPERADPAAIAALNAGQIDAVTFASSKTVRHFAQLLAQDLGPNWHRLLEGVAVASIGPQTSRDCQALLARVDIEATEFTLEGLTAALCRWAKGPEIG